MPYQISQPEVQALGDALSKYYSDAWQAGVKGLFDKMAHDNWARQSVIPGGGKLAGYLDTAADSFANLKKKSNDTFGITYKADLKKFIMVYLANKNDVASALTSVAESALKALASHIPVPHLGSIVSAAIGFGAEKAQDKLHTRAIAEADKQLSSKTGVEAQKIFSNEIEAADATTKAMEQYKLICKYIQTMPGNITSFEDAITFPGAVFKVQAAASALKIQLDRVQTYVSALADRSVQISSVSEEYIKSVRTAMPKAAQSVLQTAYDDAFKKGQGDIAQNKYSAPKEPGPIASLPGDKSGGATMLAAYLANAVAFGYYDSGNRGPMQTGRPQMAGAAPMRPGMPPPLPPRPPRP